MLVVAAAGDTDPAAVCVIELGDTADAADGGGLGPVNSCREV